MTRFLEPKPEDTWDKFLFTLFSNLTISKIIKMKKETTDSKTPGKSLPKPTKALRHFSLEKETIFLP